MSVASLASILRRLRRDIGDRARFVTGEVVEITDSSHCLVDIGKQVTAYVSPIFVPAIEVGSPVVVRVQGNQYVVADAPASPARLVKPSELGGGETLNTELIPNWMAELGGAYWPGGMPEKYRWYFGNPDVWPPTQGWVSYTFYRNGSGTDRALIAAYRVPTDDSPWSTWPCPPTAVQVTPGATYRIVVDVMTYDTANTTPLNGGDWTQVAPWDAVCALWVEWLAADQSFLWSDSADAPFWSKIYDAASMTLTDPRYFCEDGGLSRDRYATTITLNVVAPEGAAYAWPKVRAGMWPTPISRFSMKRVA